MPCIRQKRHPGGVYCQSWSEILRRNIFVRGRQFVHISRCFVEMLRFGLTQGDIQVHFQFLTFHHWADWAVTLPRLKHAEKHIIINFCSSKQQFSIKLPQNGAEQEGSEAPAEPPGASNQAGSFSQLQLLLISLQQLPRSNRVKILWDLAPEL